MSLFRPRPSPYQTAIAMVGPKPGDQVLVVGSGHPRLAAELALVTGLNGRTLVAAPPGAGPAFETAAATAGSLVELADEGSPLPTDLDVVVGLADEGQSWAAAPAPAIPRLLAALRSGGRLILFEEGTRGRFGRRSPPGDPEATLAALRNAGALAVRLLANVDGVAYFEARRAGQPV